MVQIKSSTDNQNTFHVQYLFFENRAAYEAIWKNIVQPERPQMTI